MSACYPQRRSLVWLILLLIAGASTIETYAQNQQQRLGLGGMVGRTAGISAKYFLETDSLGTDQNGIAAIDLSLAWTADDVVLWSVHVLKHRVIPSSPLQLFIGPGAALTLEDSQFSWGLSSSLGLFFVKRRFDVFLQITPRLMILPELVGEFGSAVGLRYYL